MTREQALELKIGDRVVIQRRGQTNFGTVYNPGMAVGIDWEPLQINGQEYGGRDYHDIALGAFDRIERAPK